MSNHREIVALADFLARLYAINAIEIAALAHGDKQVYRVRRSESPDWVLRAYQPNGYQGDKETVAGLAEVLFFLERQGYPAERVVKAVDGLPVTQHGEQPVLVTTFVGQPLRPWQSGIAQPAQDTPRTEDILSAEIYYAVGAALGRLHSLPLGGDQPLRHAGMLPRRELGWVTGQLAELSGRVAHRWQTAYAELVAAVKNADYCEELPTSLIHNDPNLGNVVMTATGEIVMIDWECAGLGPAVLDLGILLRNCYSKTERGVNEAAILAVVDGYARHRRLTQAELERLPDTIRFMTLVLLAAYFSERMDGTLGETDLIYGSTYATWQALYAATDQIAALARAQFERLFLSI